MIFCCCPKKSTDKVESTKEEGQIVPPAEFAPDEENVITVEPAPSKPSSPPPAPPLPPPKSPRGDSVGNGEANGNIGQNEDSGQRIEENTENIGGGSHIEHNAHVERVYVEQAEHGQPVDHHEYPDEPAPDYEPSVPPVDYDDQYSEHAGDHKGHEEHGDHEQVQGAQERIIEQHHQEEHLDHHHHEPDDHHDHVDHNEHILHEQNLHEHVHEEYDHPPYEPQQQAEDRSHNVISSQNSTATPPMTPKEDTPEDRELHDHIKEVLSTTVESLQHQTKDDQNAFRFKNDEYLPADSDARN
ncbi:unnamed protein product [Bursaphelenchus xylophilus]|uniref:(pine wood nematode) hypothetical protein n=1 Tax=Bursaphelenchus xylophilus TaxID=6326 RepID=A0A1I7SL86_BURXY|nr:unnamed protein product [Bursaphelenchus xylophilus]CAG9129411.1 unnamed protein product [Bursaphelenchus xylophilus]